MASKKKPDKSPIPVSRKYVSISMALTEGQLKRLNAAAKNHNSTRSDLGRIAINYWLEHYEADTLTSAESSLQKEIRSIRALIVKSIMLSAQATWFSALPITKAGFPEKKPPQKYMDALWNASMIFASNQLKTPLGTKADFSEEQKPISKNK